MLTHLFMYIKQRKHSIQASLKNFYPQKNDNKVNNNKVNDEKNRFY